MATAGRRCRPATYVVRVTGPSGSRFAPGQRAVELLSGDLVTVVGLEPRSHITGRVRDDRGSLVSGAEVCAQPASSDDPTCARSRADGTYDVEVRSGVYRLVVSSAPGARLVTQWARGRAFEEEAEMFDVRTADAPDVDIALIRGAALSGVVRLRGEPVKDAQVCLKTLAAPLPWSCERTDKNGAYAVVREPGRYWFWVVPPSTVAAITQWFDRALDGFNATDVDLGRDRTLDVDLVGGAQLRGHVRTEDGAPVVDALVCVDTPFPTGRICRPTDSDGSYVITTRPQTYAVQIIPPAGSGLITEYWPHKRTWVDADDVRIGATGAGLEITLRRGIIVRGTIRDRRGIPLAGAAVNFGDPADVTGAAETDVTGRYELVVPAGRYRVDVFPPFGTDLVATTRDLDVRFPTILDVTLEDLVP